MRVYKTVKMSSGISKTNALLHAAVLEDNLRAVKFLLKHGADANARRLGPRRGSTRDTLQSLCCDATISANTITDSDVFPARYRSSSFTSCTFLPTPVPVSPGKAFSTFGHKLLGHRNRSLSIADNGSKHHHHKNPAPLHIAVSKCRPEIIELLLQHGADVNAEMEGEYTALVIAAAFKRQDVAAMLVNAGADVNSRSRNGRTPLYFAVKYKQLEMVQLLLANSADAETCTEQGVTPLHVAVEHKLQDVAELLLKNGANVNARTKTGITPLHCAVVKGQREMTEMILNYGADVRAIMRKGEIDVMPLLWVTETEAQKTMDILYKYVAKTNKSGFYGSFFKKIWRHLSLRKC